MGKAPQAAIRTSALGKTYGAVTALAPLDVTIANESIVALLGSNGAGKTTLLRLLLGLASPTSGDATILGHSVSRHGVAAKAQVGYLAQAPRFPERMTPRQVLRCAARFHLSVPAAALEQRVQDALELLRLTDVADRPVRVLSGGELQRVGLGQACVHQPRILILDEPAASLDPLGRRDVLAMMRRLRQRTTILYSTHILNDVERVADHALVLDKGRLVAQGQIGSLADGSGLARYRVALRGNLSAARDRLASQPWITSVRPDGERADPETWLIEVSDRTLAEAALLPLLLGDGQTEVLRWGPADVDLEEVFAGLMERES